MRWKDSIKSNGNKMKAYAIIRVETEKIEVDNRGQFYIFTDSWKAETVLKLSPAIALFKIKEVEIS